MQQRTLYQQIAERTDGSVYIGVVGPVRTGKSTFIKRFLEQLVLPNMENVYQRERATDELPQSGSGRTITTSEPKFVPEEAVEISPDGMAKLSVRLIDTVGYLIPGAIGAEEDGQPRMVTTPWLDHEIPMADAAELGTRKVMEEHSSVGIVMTTDGTITDIPREDYKEAESRAIRDMQETGKPFTVIVNSTDPGGEAAQALAASLRETYGVNALTMDCQSMDVGGIQSILRSLMYAFPLTELRMYLPGWVQALEDDHPIKAALYHAMRCSAEKIARLSEAEPMMAKLLELETVEDFRVLSVDLGTGTVECELTLPQRLFYDILTQKAGIEIEDDADLMRELAALCEAKREYDKIAPALAQVRATGYGIVMPGAEELKLEQPQIIRKNGNYAVRLHASAPSIHMMRADIDTEISPMVGGEQESEQLMGYLLGEYEEDTDKLWQSNLFGKSLYDLVNEGLTAKITKLPDEARMKLTKTVTRMVNENSGGMICILL